MAATQFSTGIWPSVSRRNTVPHWYLDRTVLTYYSRNRVQHWYLDDSVPGAICQLDFSLGFLMISNESESLKGSILDVHGCCFLGAFGGIVLVPDLQVSPGSSGHTHVEGWGGGTSNSGRGEK